MLKTILHKGFTSILALLVLFSTVSFTIEKHFCGDVLVDVSVFVEADKCEMEALEILQKKTCCKDEMNVVQGQDELTISSYDDLEFEQQQFLYAFTHSYIFGFESLEKHEIPHKNYAPPKLVTDIQVLDQVFII
ncbi:HYC_CC_PP family protein [Tamlana sp. 2_MG-2023]|uniref:HYC_CC_PP family protein n=1 Tax=unclassified Tamlana TaxID=2614803 RepID=UPI0038B4AA2A